MRNNVPKMSVGVGTFNAKTVWLSQGHDSSVRRAWNRKQKQVQYIKTRVRFLGPARDPFPEPTFSADSVPVILAFLDLVYLVFRLIFLTEHMQSP